MKKFFFILAFISLFSLSAFSDNWTLGVMEFSFKQTQTRSESSSKAASVLPQLIIEHFSSDEVRSIPERESLDRKLKELQTARLSLFLQLSKEYKARDALVLTTVKPKALEKAIKAEMEKIREIEKKIDENLEEVKKAKDKAQPKIEREIALSEGKKVDDSQKKERGFFFRFPFPFFRQEEEDKIVSESVVLYKNDSTALFKVSEKSMEAGFTSWDFAQEVANAKINGLITGEITCYGDYCSVAVSLRVYPGAQILGTVREVGLLSDLMPLADSIAQNLDSIIANALPVMIEVEINPPEAAPLAKIMVDSTVFSLRKTNGAFDNRILMDSGIHHVSIEVPGYEKLAFNYSFTDDTHFFVHANLVPEVHGLAKIRLKKYRDGIFHTYGLLQSPVTEKEPWASLEVNNKSVLGVFTLPKSDSEDSSASNIAFFRIPESSAFDGANLLVNAKPFDRAANIDKRRRWMYTAYTALICSLPFTFYHMGAFTTENTAYSQGRGDYDTLKNLQLRSNICLGITAVCGVWTVIELVRYLWAADRVLPAGAKIDKKAMAQNSLFENPLEPEENAANETEVPTEDEKSDKIISNKEILVE